MANQLEIVNVNVSKFQKDLIDWFSSEQRQLPWREDQDPYKVWVSEIMLQQTRVDTVIPYFNHFIEKFPTIDALANADEESVLKAWEGLGYYSRVRNLHSAVKEVVENYGGQVPDTPDEISKLKGVGPYTAGAILSIAFARPEPAVDGNVMRVLSRILHIREDIAKPSTRKIFESAVKQLISKDNPSYFNQALMELGALICTPTSPSCLLCPVRDHCSGFHEGVQHELPVKTTKKSQRHVQLAAAILIDPDGRLLIRKRPNKGLLANLWEFPNIEAPLTFQSEKEQLTAYLNETLETEVNIEASIGQIEHIFSHLSWSLRIYKGTAVGKEIKVSNSQKLVSVVELSQYALPVPFQKSLQLYLDSLLTP